MENGEGTNYPQLAPAVTNAVRIIELLSGDSSMLGLAEISRKLDINKNMIFRILDTLLHENWVYFDESTGKYQLTLQPFQVTSRSLTRLSLYNASLPFVEALWREIGESIYLAVLRDGQVVYLNHMDSIRSVKVAGRVGASYPAHCTAPGKALLAFSRRDVIESICATAPFEKQTNNTITDADALKAELSLVKERGYAYDDEEYGYGIICYAAPIINRSGWAVGAIGCSGSMTTCTPETVKGVYGHAISEAARKISLILGYTGDDPYDALIK